MSVPDDHSRIARIEEAQKSILRTLDEMHADALRREGKMDSIAQEYVRFKAHREDVCMPLHARIDKLGKDCDERINRLGADCDGNFKGLDVRVRALEAFKWRAVGAVGVITFIANLVAQKL